VVVAVYGAPVRAGWPSRREVRARRGALPDCAVPGGVACGVGGAWSEPRWLAGLDAAELAGVIGARFRDLARHQPAQARHAVTYIERALELRDPVRVRNRSFDLIGLARAHLVTAEPDRGCELIAEVRPVSSLSTPSSTPCSARPVRTRMRTGFFPFVEPGFEIDMQCQVCFGRSCRTCHHAALSVSSATRRADHHDHPAPGTPGLDAV
jgi:hypothetical protein